MKESQLNSMALLEKVIIDRDEKEAQLQREKMSNADLRAELAAERDAYSRAVLVQDELVAAYERIDELLNDLRKNSELNNRGAGG